MLFPLFHVDIDVSQVVQYTTRILFGAEVAHGNGGFLLLLLVDGVCGRGKSLPTPRINAEAIDHTNDFQRERVRRNAYKRQLTTNQLAFQGAILTAFAGKRLDWLRYKGGGGALTSCFHELLMLG